MQIQIQIHSEIYRLRHENILIYIVVIIKIGITISKKAI